ncbi:hypothetical protein OPV22_021961 [Ensete ventricosum]|uniref:Uncharacterized protein n=1 Tax=Ensete ventricosum TaxID=4639 RepID=A0AAV8QEF2_ENSVE|nr:hypothetical protein OPV22_021961 [Ensete ventricosum]
MGPGPFKPSSPSPGCERKKEPFFNRFGPLPTSISRGSKSRSILFLQRLWWQRPYLSSHTPLTSTSDLLRLEWPRDSNG